MASQNTVAMGPLVLSQTSPLPPSPLLTIPLEVLLQITRNLNTTEYCTFRLTNKHIEEMLRNAFAREYFCKRQFMLTEFSLKALVGISISRFAGSITHVILGLEQPGVQAQGYTDHVTFMKDNRDVELLAEAFAKLPNLETVGMRDFNARSRYRDGQFSVWRSYGSNTYRDENGLAPDIIHPFEIQHDHNPMWREKIDFLGRVFLSILHSLALSPSRPQNYEVILRRLSLHDRAFAIPDDILPIVQPVLGQLRSLFLDLNSNLPSYVQHPDPTASVPSYRLKLLLGKLPNLKHLRLNFAKYTQLDHMKDLLQWLSTPASTLSLPSGSSVDPSTTVASPPPIDLPSLTQLDIGMLQIEASVLLKIYKKFKSTLKGISCHKVRMLNTDTANPRKKVNLWANFFADLSKIDLNLTAISMTSLSQQRFRNGRYQVESIERSVIFKDSRKNQYSRSWAGTNTKSALRDFHAHVAVQWLINDKDESGSDSMSSADEADENDEDDDDLDEDIVDDEDGEEEEEEEEENNNDAGDGDGSVNGDGANQGVVAQVVISST